MAIGFLVVVVFVFDDVFVGVIVVAVVFVVDFVVVVVVGVVDLLVVFFVDVVVVVVVVVVVFVVVVVVVVSVLSENCVYFASLRVFPSSEESPKNICVYFGFRLVVFVVDPNYAEIY